ncbi:MAG TPA: hypothetical protein DDZ67_09100 [Xanthomonadaceae bacterium]|nr:hypothetical protein [Xanthomonadaceae bacterium]
MEYHVQYRDGRRWVTLDVCADRHAVMDRRAERIASLVERGCNFVGLGKDFRVRGVRQQVAA